ncbi:MAG: DUF4384 domain-containing protein, partial [Pirellulaceae bacterium]
IRNDRPAFLVRASVDHPDRVYREGDTMQVTVRSEKAGYLYLVYCPASGKAHVLFPNKYQQNNRIPENRDVVVPADLASFRIRIAPPLGDEVLKAIVTLQPVKEIDIDTLTKSALSTVDYKGFRNAVIEEFRPQPSQWAEHHVKIRTVPKQVASAPPRPRRFGVFIGISDYQDRRISKLGICHIDAKYTSEAMQKNGKMDQVFLLLDSQATLKQIEDTIRRRLVNLTRPGDEVFIYWSGHGGRCADDNGDEKDGLDEFVVPYDADITNLDTMRRTMLLDDTFGRWLQEMDGRKVVVILDTCHSAGQAALEKGLMGVDGLPNATGPLDFFDGEFTRTKDIGQKETAMLASSRAAQVSFVRREGDLSAMTYFLIELMKTSERPVTLVDAFQYLEKNLPQYVQANFPGTTQTPVLVDATTPPVYLRP